MKKNFDEIILGLPEINLNEKRARYGNCPYGDDGFGGCNDMREVVVVGNRNNNDGGGIAFPTGGPGGPGDGPEYRERTGDWVDQPCAGCSELEQPRPTWTPVGRALIPTHRAGCGGAERKELRHKVWQKYDNCQ